MTMLDLLFPPRCPFCADILTSSAPVCKKCMASLPFAKKPLCEKCGRPVGEFSHKLCRICRQSHVRFEKAVSPLLYRDNARKCIVRFKYCHHPYYAKGLAFLMADRLLRENDILNTVDFITFVPQNFKTHVMRGYNQTYLLAKEFARIAKLPLIRTLKRVNDSPRQVTLNAVQRRANAAKAFFPTDTPVSGTALLIDDVLTTGATANRCAELLLKMGCEKVYVCTAATASDE